MTTKRSVYKKLREVFSDSLDAAFRIKFGVACETGYNLISMQTVTTRVDGKKLTKAQYAWIEAYCDGFGHAMEITK